MYCGYMHMCCVLKSGKERELEVSWCQYGGRKVSQYLMFRRKEQRERGLGSGYAISLRHVLILQTVKRMTLSSPPFVIGLRVWTNCKSKPNSPARSCRFCTGASRM